MNIIKFFKNFFNKALIAFKAFMDAAIPIARQIIIGQLAGIAQEAVKELESGNLTNEEKRKEAFNRIGNYAKTNGIAARDSLINALIELTVLSFKKEF